MSLLPDATPPEQVILVDADDREIGAAEKLEAHRRGLLHRAISVFVFNGQGEMLLQRRAEGKYHSAGLWSNACCTHPRPGESTAEAAARRLAEEMGFGCPLEPAFSFVYRVQLTEALAEHEYDHVLLGRYEGAPAPNPDEVMAWRWAGAEALRRDVAARPEAYTYWFREVYERALGCAGL